MSYPVKGTCIFRHSADGRAGDGIQRRAAQSGAGVVSARTYQYPSDCLRITEIMLPGVRNPTAAMRVQYEVGADAEGTGKLIYTDQAQAWLKYVTRITDVNMFDAIFMEALAWRLAAAINMALTGNADLGNFALNMYNRVILSAGSHSQNESQEPQPPVDEFTVARLS